MKDSKHTPLDYLLENFLCSGCLHERGNCVIRGKEHIVVQCARCGLANLLPRLDRAEDTKLLDSLAHYHESVSGLEAGFHYHASKLLRLLQRYSDPPGRLLEIGCATGLFLRHAATAGYSVVGLEPVARDRELIPAEIADCVMPMRLEDADFPENSFDVVVVIQVIEHLVRPAVFAEKLNRILKPGGIAYIETPNFNALSRHLRIQSWIDNNAGYGGHWHLFTPVSMRIFCERMNLHLVECWTFFKSLGIYGRSPMLGKVTSITLDQTFGRLGMGNNVAALVSRGRDRLTRV